MAVDKDTLRWQERFEEKNTEEHRILNLKFVNLDKSIALMTQEVRTLGKDTNNRTDALQVKVEDNDKRTGCLEKYKNAKVIQLKMINYLIVGVGIVIGFLVSIKELMFGGK